MHGKKLNINKPFLYQMVPVVGKIMEDYYPEVLADKDYIEKVIKSEEDRFNETLTDGLELLNSIIADTKADHSKVISGKDAFRLFDTYGFPLELAKEYAEDQGMEIDEAGFADEMQKQKERARSARSNAKSMGVQSDLLTDLKTPSEYVGYDTLKVDAAVLKDIIQDDQLTDTVNPGEARVLFDVTPFYAEMGGQVADQGVIEDADGNVVAEVVDVQHAPNGQNLHTIKAKREMHTGESFTLIVDRAFHLKVEKNHTATHLLDQALRDVLGEHTHQAGSLVEPGYLRFDFTHFGQVTDEDLQKVEEIINDKIYDEIPVTTVETDLETGKKMGAIALFDDKYGKKVRVVSVGDYSREFCGGTHVKNTNEIGLFKIVSESGVGAGVRRIEAVTSQAALEFLNGEEALLQKAAGLLKSAQMKDVPAKVEQLQAQVKDLNQTINQLEAKIAQAEVANIYDQVQEINGIRLITAEVQVSGMDQLRQMADDWKTKDQSDVLVLGAKIGEKANLIAAVKDPLVKEGLKAGDLIKAIAPKVNGGGGGRPNMAQAGGSAPEKINEALQAASEWLETQGK